ncbi:MAG: 1-acyl-sn-glycerol-3-phosphate acyltransferase [Spirochaetia bacterium]|nr:1-acyl-sn-glycerol-3-phosphate acyltransferase [Spirochaetia bacterium]
MLFNRRNNKSVLYLQKGWFMSKTPWLIKLVRPTYGKWMLHHYDVRLEGYEKLPQKGPFLVIGNHTHIYDPVFLSSSTPFHIHWVMGAYLFKTKLLNFIFDKLVKGISKQQGKSDMHTIKAMRETLSHNGVVGFFPEGTRTWDGDSTPVNDATAKLIRLFRVPVVVFHLEGAYNSKPRWASERRKGPIILKVVKVIQKEDFEHKSIKELTSLLNSSLTFSADKWQKKSHIPYKSTNRAKWIEQVLYACPSCSSFSTIEGSKDTFKCNNCHSSWQMNEFDEIKGINETPFYPSVALWHTWEQSLLEELAKKESSVPLFTTDDGLLFQCADGNKLIVLSKNFSFNATNRTFIVHVASFMKGQTCFSEKTIVFNFDAISSIIINAKSTLEFTHASRIYRVRIKPAQSILKYVELYHIYLDSYLKEGI